MARLITVALRLLIWLLLSADITLINFLIGLLVAVLLPMVIAVVLGLGALLFSLGDKAGAAACGRISLVIGVAWFLALAATATASGIMTLEGSAGRPARPVRPVRPDDPPLEQ